VVVVDVTDHDGAEEDDPAGVAVGLERYVLAGQRRGDEDAPPAPEQRAVLVQTLPALLTGCCEDASSGPPGLAGRSQRRGSAAAKRSLAGD
jgi:hypothetical protein